MAWKCVLVLAVLVGGVAVLMTWPPLELYAVHLQDLTVSLTEALTAVIEKITPTSQRVLTKAELEEYDGTPGSKGLYLAILGQVFDVSKGERHYGPGKGYSFFAAKDGSRAFVTGEFNKEGLVDDLQGLSPSQIFQFRDWLKLYETDYVYVGVLHGNFYDEAGRPTVALDRVKEAMAIGEKEKLDKQAEEKKFPSCNSEWSQASGGRVWCSRKSGGISRGWAGVPRQYHPPGGGGTRCVCIRSTGPPTDMPTATSNRGDLDNPNFKVYEGCHPSAESCPLVKK